ncbi:DNA ligase 1-like [Galleria mellonella]|uniref:DNA ligase 1-like n=1 Tax=Galleria mellonella TaxID=7137 RepID=A0A6J1X2Y7_GALME|nr:DNA ligase 1-like [Galleria mellonella]
MEKRKESLSALKLCRFCLCQDNSITNLYDRSRKPKNAIPLSVKILSSISIEIFPSDKMPSFICNRCRFFMDICYEFKQLCHQTDETILNYIQNGTPMESIAWPSQLTKLYKSAKTILKEPVINSIVEGGATVHVTSQEYDSEDDDNMYNVKINELEDGSEMIKNETDFAKETTSRKEFSSVSKLTRHVRSHAGKRAYPCKYCNKSFIKSHHYTRHLRVKHRLALHGNRGPFGQMEQFRCEQCEDTFTTQDELIYHSAIHATQNLTCPLCQEKFENVDAVTTHIKSHVNGIEFMCDLCELVFTSKEKLDCHLTTAHEDELRNSQDSSMEMDAEDEDDDNGINVKEEGDHMIVEIKKADNFMLNVPDESESKIDNTNSEESESEATYTELSTVDTLAVVRKESLVKTPEKVPPKRTTATPIVSATPAASVTPVASVTPTASITSTASVTPAATAAATPGNSSKNDTKQTASILRKAEEIKRKAQQSTLETNKLSEEKNKEKPNNKVESTNSVGASDKSLRLLEKELQDLKRTNSRSEPAKMPAKNSDTFRLRRPQIHTSTPKQRLDEKKPQPPLKTAIEKKVPERRTITKENKEPKEIKEVKTSNTNVKDNNEKELKEKELKEKEVKEKELKEKELKEKDASKSVIKNGNSDKNSSEDNVRRSTRPSKIKDYAKMIRDRTQESEEEDSDMDDEEYDEKQTDSRVKVRRNKVPPKPNQQASSSPTAVATPATRKRGRPRKDQPKEVPNKLKKEEQTEEDVKEKKAETPNDKKKSPSPEKENKNEDASENRETEPNKTSDNSETKSPSDVLVSPTGQTLKKVPIKALPPGVKPLPLPATTRPIGTGELCEMQIGKKMVKVQKIVMTKAEVEAMAKKGLVEMKDGTMVLKQGIKLPTADPLALKSTLVGEKETLKESPAKKIKTDESKNL